MISNSQLCMCILSPTIGQTSFLFLRLLLLTLSLLITIAKETYLFTTVILSIVIPPSSSSCFNFLLHKPFQFLSQIGQELRTQIGLTFISLVSHCVNVKPSLAIFLQNTNIRVIQEACENLLKNWNASSAFLVQMTRS